jgi:hypothetical protein
MTHTCDPRYEEIEERPRSEKDLGKNRRHYPKNDF